MTVLLVVGGLVLLLAGGEILVRGAIALARLLGVSPLVIGLTVVAFGTSAPELVVSLEAALSGHPGIVLGNVVGSNIANVLMIIGAAALIRPIAAAPTMVRQEGGTLVVASLVFVGLCWIGDLTRPLGLLMVLALAGYTLWSFWNSRRQSEAASAAGVEAVAELSGGPRSVPVAGLFTLAGIVGVVIGADLLVEGAVEVARWAGLSEAVIGLTLIAIGTSLPELATSVMAALRGHGSLSIGNAIGSNLFNMFGIAGVTAAVVPISVPEQVLAFDLWVMLAVTLFLVGAMVSGGRVGRGLGALMLALYALYLVSLVAGWSAVAPS